MKINLSPTYISDASSARRQPIIIDVSLDPSANSITAPFKQSRQNGYIFPSNNNKSLIATISGIQNTIYVNPGDPGSNPNPPAPPTPTPGTPPLKIENLVATWDGDNIKLTFDFDLTDAANQFFDHLNIGLSTDAGTTYAILTPIVPYDVKFLSSSSINQVVEISTNDQTTTGLYNTIGFNSVEVATYDSLNQTAGYVIASLAGYSVNLPAPIITEANATSAYTITTTNLEAAKVAPYSGFLSEIIQEFVYPTTGLTSDQVDAAVVASLAANGPGWVTVGEPKTVSPVSVFEPSGLHRYVRAWFMSTKGGKSAYSNYVEAKSDPLLPANNLPPANATNVSAAFSNSGTGNDIVVSYTLPTIVDSDVNKPVNVKVKLVPTAANTLSAFFYHTIVNSSETSFTIPSNLIFAQFGKYYTSYLGTLVLQSQYGTDSSSAQTINTFSRTSTISSVVPTATVTNVVDGYNVQFALGNSGASYGEVYQFFIDPTGSFNTVDMPDYMDTTYSSGGASGQKTFVVQSISMENEGFTLPNGKSVNTYVGYGITGTGIPSNTWVTSITGSGPYTITLNNNLTQQASGNYHMQSLVYSGAGPANVFDNYYSTAYLILIYYDIYDQPSQNSLVYQVTPTNPATSIINNAVQIGSGGSIYVGTSATTGSRIVLGPSGNKGPDGTSAYSGIFAFDYGSTSSTAASTAIITNPGASGYTFETVNAKIADWSINGTQIQNTLGTASNYVGLSATGPYSFWAGSATSGGDSQAKFTVTSQGAVVARNIQIIGSGNNSDTLISAGAYFSVKGDGTINASNANITGSINVNQASTFNSSVIIGSSGYLVVNGSGGAYVKIGGAGIQASPNGSAITTQISSSPIGEDGVTLATNSAYLGSLSSRSGAWIVKSGKIYSGQIELDSTNGYITAYPTDYNANQNSYGVRIYGGSSTSNGYAISVGSLTGTPNFSVNHAGILTATNAIISGNVTANSFTIDSNNYWNDGTHTGDFRIGSTNNYLLYTNSTLKLQNSNILSGKTSASDTTNSGYFIGSNGSVIFGTASTYISYSGSQITSTTTIPAGYYVGSDGQAHTQAQTQTITLGTDGLHIHGLSVYGDDSRLGSIGATTDPTTGNSVTSYSPFTRVIQYAPQNQTYGNTQINGGDAVTGFAIYYGNHSPTSGGTNTGFSGDLWVQI